MSTVILADVLLQVGDQTGIIQKANKGLKFGFLTPFGL